MESNKDEAIRCLAIAQRHRDASNLPSAVRFAQKSLNLFTTREAEILLKSLQDQESSGSSSSGSSSTSADTRPTPRATDSNPTFTSSTEAHPSASGATHRHTASTSKTAGKGKGNGTAGGQGGEKREYTAEQHAVVKRVRACKVTQFYEILAVERTCEEADIKKAYRKLALQLHPDKNGAPGADEAFKMVSKAFQILSDSDKRAAYDESGGDPDSRASASPSFTRAGPGGGGFDGEISPEELFNMFFGGGMGSGAGFGQTGFTTFGGTPVFTANFSPGGFRTARRAGATRGPRAANAEQTENRSLLMQILPLLILFGFSLLSALPSLFGSSPPPFPDYSFRQTTRFDSSHTTKDLGIDFWVNKAEFSKNPTVHAGNDVGGGRTVGGSGLSRFEKKVENVWTQEMWAQCQRGADSRRRRKEDEMGVFGIGTDWEKVKKIEQEKVESCEVLKQKGLLTRDPQ